MFNYSNWHWHSVELLVVVLTTREEWFEYVANTKTDFSYDCNSIICQNKASEKPKHFLIFRLLNITLTNIVLSIHTMTSVYFLWVLTSYVCLPHFYRFRKKKKKNLTKASLLCSINATTIKMGKDC